MSSQARYARNSTVNQDPIPDNLFRGDEPYADGYSNYPKLWDLDVPENPLRNESPAVREVAKYLTARRNWGEFKGVGKNALRFRQRPFAEFLKMSRSTFRRSLARCHELVIFEKPLGFIARSRVAQTVIVLADRWVKACRSHSGPVKSKPRAEEKPKTPNPGPVKTVPYIEGKNSQNKTTPTPKGYGEDRLSPKEFRLKKLAQSCKGVLRRFCEAGVTEENVGEVLSPDDRRILGECFTSVAGIDALMLKLSADPTVRDAEAVLAKRMAKLLQGRNLTILGGKLETAGAQ